MAYIAVTALCGLVIGLALYLLVRTLRRMAKGRCCEGCTGCRHREGCSSRDPDAGDAANKRKG